MEITKLIDGNLGKRMVAFAVAAWLIKESVDPRQQLLIAAIGVAYMVCQTISDWKGKVKETGDKP